MKPHGRTIALGLAAGLLLGAVSVVRFVQATALAAVIFITASAAFFLV